MRDVKIPNWLEQLPLAPEYRPTDTEFSDPIAYISKIEKEAGTFGICKVIPPLPKPSKKYVASNLNKSLTRCPELGPEVKLPEVCSESAVFTTRQQEFGQNGKKAVRKHVWQSGEVYTLEQFETKAKGFARGQLGDVRAVSPLVVEALFWEAVFEKPMYVEYANDVPGSGFGEPTGPYQYLNSRNRRRKTFRRNCGGNHGIMKPPWSDSSTNGGEEGPEVPIVLSDQELKPLDPGNEMEGSAGWKLSKSPWNLQVIARSPGSLTRFMPDDIPGVTSPMVYIGMLFSWFAWHVEDHELHSMNFLHTGSPKTWYSVPGDYAFDFEEVICRQAYGENVDCLAALTMLGEKTTVLSPEVLVESGIPCCRLVQNPGEFVVTFPRAYHVGFSHGFNCGEAANFGTPKWLEVAKEAAVRRAAMNYLPMLSHQQLLYLLTMSFVSRVPRSLLPGARSSRLRDRQKDGRELSVKKAFVDDILSENKLVTIVLERCGSSRVVLWDLESLPSLVKVPELCSPSTTVSTAKDNVSSDNKNNQDLLRDMSLYMETVNDLYMDDDDLSGDFQLDSGSLPCVACGILGFPFMTVVQPSERATLDLLQDARVSKHDHSHSTLVANSMVDPVLDGTTENIGWHGSNLLHHSHGESQSGILSTSHDPCPLDVPKVPLEPQFENGWCSTSGFLRPRVFCLEHTINIVDMLHSKGGANVLVICHSDFKKMKAHAAVISEQICSPFGYNEIPLDNATQFDLNLIDLAIDDQEHDECGKDWTSKLRVNLRRFVEVRKSSPHKPEEYALALGRLFSSTNSSSNIVDLKWPFTKSRSKRNLKKSSEPIRMGKLAVGNSNESMPKEKGQVLVVKSDANIIRNEESDAGFIRKEVKLIQYSRRRFKCKHGNSINNKTITKQVLDLAPVVDCGDQNEHSIEDRSLKDHGVKIGGMGKESSGLSLPSSNGNFELEFGSGVTVSSLTICSAALRTQIPKCNSDSATGDDFMMQNETEVDKITSKIETSNAGSSCSIVVTAEAPQNSIVQEENMNAVDVSIDDVGCVGNCEGRSTEGIVSMKGTSDLVALAPSCGSDSLKLMTESLRVEEVEMFPVNTEVGNSVEEQDIQGTTEDKGKEPVAINNDTATDRYSVVSKEVSVEVSITNAVDEMGTDGYHSLPDKGQLESAGSTMVCQKSNAKDRSKRRRELDLQVDNQFDLNGFMRSPCEGLRPRSSKHAKIGKIDSSNVVAEISKSKKSRTSVNSSVSHKDKQTKVGEIDSTNVVKENSVSKRSRISMNRSVSHKMKKDNKKGSHLCDLENCRMRFHTKEALMLHKRNRCSHKGCGKRFTSHKYTVLHQRVHDDDRPLKCPWKGCDMSFKWAWSRIEHMRLHTGERPYSCKVEGCGLTFRFISDFSRHRRKTGHYVPPLT